MYIWQKGRFISSLMKRMSRGGRHLGEDELVTDTCNCEKKWSNLLYLPLLLLCLAQASK